MKFNRFYAAAPVCSPTRGSCITGRHPFRYGILANSGHMKPEELTLAELLKKQGYTTGHFGKWHLGTLTKTVKDVQPRRASRREKLFTATGERLRRLLQHRVEGPDVGSALPAEGQQLQAVVGSSDGSK